MCAKEVNKDANLQAKRKNENDYQFSIGEPVWVHMDPFPWWPAKLVTKEDIVLDPGESYPEQAQGCVLVEFFNDDNRFASIHTSLLRPFAQAKFRKLNKNYDGEYVNAIIVAMQEADKHLKQWLHPSNHSKTSNQPPPQKNKQKVVSKRRRPNSADSHQNRPNRAQRKRIKTAKAAAAATKPIPTDQTNPPQGTLLQNPQVPVAVVMENVPNHVTDNAQDASRKAQQQTPAPFVPIQPIVAQHQIKQSDPNGATLMYHDFEKTVEVLRRMLQEVDGGIASMAQKIESQQEEIHALRMVGKSGDEKITRGLQLISEGQVDLRRQVRQKQS